MLYEYDRLIQKQGFQMIAGVDEAGRGPLAGPVYAAAVILDLEKPIAGLNDSKKLTEKKRELLYQEIIQSAVAYAVAAVSAQEIDKINILQASLLAMRNAVEQLGNKPDLLLVDGNQDPKTERVTRLVVGGDAISASIAAASILAKVTRDRFCKTMDQCYPDYEFARHKGYGTKLHYEKLDTYGPCAEHRRTFLKKWQAR